MSNCIKSLFVVALIGVASGQTGSCPVTQNSQQPAASFAPVAPVGSILLTLENQSGMSVVVQANFIAGGEQVRQTTRLLAPSGPESSARIFRTTADAVDVSARIATPNDGSETKYTGGFQLASGHYVNGVDYGDQGSIDFIVPGPPPDCNGNGVPDANDIAAATSRDCDRDGIPDECEPGLPTIQHCAGDAVISADASGLGQVPDLTHLLAAVDSCTPRSQVVITQDVATGTPLVLNVPTVVTLTVTDGDGNSVKCESTVTMIDDTAPVITCPNRLVVNTDRTCHAAVPDFSTLIAVTDNTTPLAALTFVQDLAAGTSVSPGLYPVKLTVTDASGNASDCQFDLRVKPAFHTIGCFDPIDQ